MTRRAGLCAVLPLVLVAFIPCHADTPARKLPSAYDSAVVLLAYERNGSSVTCRAVDSIIVAVLKQSIPLAFPDIDRRHWEDTPLERQAYDESAEAESLRGVLRARLPSVLGATYLLKLGTGFPQYDLTSKSFLVETGWSRDVVATQYTSLPVYTEDDMAVIKREGKHVVGGVWFEGLPLKAYSAVFGLAISSALAVSIPDRETALLLEQRRKNLDVCIGFRLTGDTKSSKSAQFAGGQYPVAKNPVVMVVDRESQELLWSSSD